MTAHIPFHVGPGNEPTENGEKFEDVSEFHRAIIA